MKETSIPKEVIHVVETLEKAGYEAYLIGGCTRDLLLGRKPKDWDVTTNATPEQIIPLFVKTFYAAVTFCFNSFFKLCSHFICAGFKSVV